MSRIAERFAMLKSEGRKGFIPFVTAGDPDLETSLAIIRQLARIGADVIELGVPFSDPMADGPVIQRSSQRAIDAGTTLTKVLNIATAFRESSDVPLILFSYFNPILRMGLDKFIAAAVHAGIDGLLVTDIVEDEAAEVSARLSRHGLDLISLIAPTTSDDRLGVICGQARGFIYAVSRAGVTGARETTSSEAELLVKRARAVTDLPIAVGFGISSREQVEDVWRYADAAVVGSALVSEIEEAESPGDAALRIREFVRQLLPQFAKTGPEN